MPETITFLLAAPILNPITIVVTYQAFGFSDGILFWRVLGGFLIANFVGWLFSRHPRPEDLLIHSFRIPAGCTAMGASRTGVCRRCECSVPNERDAARFGGRMRRGRLHPGFRVARPAAYSGAESGCGLCSP